MTLLLVILCSTPSLFASAQTEDHYDTIAVYKTVLDSLFRDDKVIALTAGKVVYADIYGDYDAIREKNNEEMAAQGKIMVLWVEPERYPKSVATLLRENGVAFDTLKLGDLVRTKPMNLQHLLPTYTFVRNNTVPLAHSFFGNLFKNKSVLRFSELLFLKNLNVVVLKVSIEKRSNKESWFEMIVLRKVLTEWRILDRMKSSR